MSEQREALAEALYELFGSTLYGHDIGPWDSERVQAERNHWLRKADRLLASDALARLLADAEQRGAAEAEAKHRDLTSRLGFGDNITEPQADNDAIVAWFEQQSRDANEWQESQLWRNDCHVAGHPDDEDCWEHDPILRAEQRGADRVAAADMLAPWGPFEMSGFEGCTDVDPSHCACATDAQPTCRICEEEIEPGELAWARQWPCYDTLPLDHKDQDWEVISWHDECPPSDLRAALTPGAADRVRAEEGGR